ncbi:hypothetical protein, variant 1 [Capsaspora owczarzaki ATCC 30864]|uniref:Elongator complex protein 6 n=1 Tax=Capsaspora owczarzaki (strain ATCC 30864) TaxID=595528 RepID=A0A0D2WR90_CAPO3|nr:hypothetical protein, variant 1 [Capsaspora owczarzaki ATCC 30864]
MFEGLNAALSLSNTAPPTELQGSLVLCADTLEADGGFLLHHWLATHLKTGAAVVLVSFAHIQNHFALVARKLGINLAQLEARGMFRFIGGLDVPSTDAQSQPSSGDFHLDLSNPAPLKELHQRIQDTLKAMEASRRAANPAGEDATQTPVCIILDSVDTLFHATGGAITPAALLGFIHSCRSFPLVAPAPCLVVSVHADALFGGAKALFATLKHQAQVTLTVSGLPSGYSKDVHGQVRIVCLVDFCTL